MSSVPNPIPRDWLQRQLLPTDLVTLDELRRRYDAWTSPNQEQMRDAHGMITMTVDMLTGRLLTPRIDGVPLDPVDELVADLHEFAEQSHLAVMDDWQHGDELWLFRSPRESWAAMAGRGGYVWLRGGRNHHAHCTVVN